jgi:hypothetical protein
MGQSNESNGAGSSEDDGEGVFVQMQVVGGGGGGGWWKRMSSTSAKRSLNFRRVIM